MQSLMLHNILVRKKSILDQFRQDLSILGLLDEIERSLKIALFIKMKQGVSGWLSVFC